MQDNLEALGTLMLWRQAERNVAGPDAFLGTADALGDGRFRDEEGSRDFTGRQAADRAEGQRELGCGRNRGVGTQKEERQCVVVLRRKGLRPRGRLDQLISGHLLRCPFLASPPCVLAPQLIGQTTSADGDQPAAGIVRDALRRPLQGRREERLLDSVLGKVEVAIAAHERAEDARRELTQQVLGGKGGVRRHISAPASSMTGLTSTAQKRAAGSWVTISAARSMVSVSS